MSCCEQSLGRGGGEMRAWRSWAEGMAEVGGGVQNLHKKGDLSALTGIGQYDTAAKNDQWHGKIRVAIYGQNRLKTFILHKQYDLSLIHI